MLTALVHKQKLLEEFYLDDDDMTIRRNKNGYHGRFEKHDKVVPFCFVGGNGYDYSGIHIPRTRTSVSLPWLLTVLRGVEFSEKSVLDHKDGDIANNVRSNIRVVTQQINCKNRKLRNDSTTGYTGVNWNENAELFYVRRVIGGKRLYRSSKTLEGALVHLEELKQLGLKDGYTARHDEQGATTIPKGSTSQAIGDGSAQHPINIG